MAIELDEVQRLIQTALPGAEVEVVDETGTQDHLQVTVAAEQFDGLSRLEQHKLVKAAVRDQTDSGEIHSFTVKTKAK